MIVWKHCLPQLLWCCHPCSRCVQLYSRVCRTRLALPIDIHITFADSSLTICRLYFKVIKNDSLLHETAIYGMAFPSPFWIPAFVLPNVSISRPLLVVWSPKAQGSQSQWDMRRSKRFGTFLLAFGIHLIVSSAQPPIPKRFVRTTTVVLYMQLFWHTRLYSPRDYAFLAFCGGISKDLPDFQLCSAFAGTV